MSEHAIRTEGLTRTYDSGTAVDGLTLQVPAGAVFAFLGPNGAGKTTTIRLLLGLLRPTAGRAEVLGRDPGTQGQQVRERCGALLEHTGLYERLSAEDNLELYGRIWGMPAGDRRARIRELLEPLGLYERRRERVGAWSRGMKQKLAVARAMLHRPRLVFLDEPSAGLDPEATVALRDDICRLAAGEGTTVFLTTHNLAEAERMCTAVAIVRRGRLLATGTPRELALRASRPRIEIVGRNLRPAMATALAEHPAVEHALYGGNRITLHTREALPLSTPLSVIAAAGGEVEHVRTDDASLEEAYLQLMAG